MALGIEDDNQEGDTNTGDAGGVENPPNAQAEDNSIGVGGIHVGGSITIGHGYTAKQVAVLLKQISSTFQPKPFDGCCPYKGLDVFEEEDSELFFGCDRLKILVGQNWLDLEA